MNESIVKMAPTIYENEASAAIALNLYNFETVGELVGFRYKTGADEYPVDCITVMSVKTGVGKDKYSVISDHTLFLIKDVVYNSIPDVAEVAYGEVYILVKTLFTEEQDPEEAEVVIEESNDSRKYYFVIFDKETGTVKLTQIDFGFYFYNLTKKKLCYLEPTAQDVIDLTKGLLAMGDLEERVSRLEQTFGGLNIYVEGTTLVIEK